jgi:hypothetical protein
MGRCELYDFALYDSRALGDAEEEGSRPGVVIPRDPKGNPGRYNLRERRETGMNLWTWFKEWRKRPWTVYIDIEQGDPIILPGAKALICHGCARIKGQNTCGHLDRCWDDGFAGWHPVGTIRVDEERLYGHD